MLKLAPPVIGSLSIDNILYVVESEISILDMQPTYLKVWDEIMIGRFHITKECIQNIVKFRPTILEAVQNEKKKSPVFFSLLSKEPLRLKCLHNVKEKEKEKYY